MLTLHLNVFTIANRAFQTCMVYVVMIMQMSFYFLLNGILGVQNPTPTILIFYHNN